MVRETVAVSRPQTRYAWNGDVALAYQVLGDGPIDLVYLQGSISNVEANWDVPPLAHWLRQLSEGVRLIMFDRRGYGCSDGFSPDDVTPLEVMVEDMLAVMDAAGCERAVVFGWEECGFLAIQFVASRPERSLGLVLFNSAPTWQWSEDMPWEWTWEQWQPQLENLRHGGGSSSRVRSYLELMDPGRATDPEYVELFARYWRLCQAPGAAVAETEKWGRVDLRHLLPLIQVPSLVLHRTSSGTNLEPVETAHYLAANIPGAELVILDDASGSPWAGDSEALLREIRRFAHQLEETEATLDRVLATILFTDIVGSTKLAAQLGDHEWKRVLERHHSVVRALIARYRGREIDTAGDGFFATFPGPMRAVHCGLAIIASVRPLGLEIRAGVHTGECEQHGDTLAGIGVHIGARVAAAAGAGEVFVSPTVPGLVAGSDLRFEDQGERTLKGVPGSVRLYSASRAPEPIR